MRLSHEVTTGLCAISVGGDSPVLHMGLAAFLDREGIQIFYMVKNRAGLIIFLREKDLKTVRDWVEKALRAPTLHA